MQVKLRFLHLRDKIRNDTAKKSAGPAFCRDTSIYFTGAGGSATVALIHLGIGHMCRYRYSIFYTVYTRE